MKKNSRFVFYLGLGFFNSAFCYIPKYNSPEPIETPKSYSDYIAPIRDSLGKDCLGLLYKSDIIITSQGCFNDDDYNPQKVWITSHNKTNNTNQTSYYYVLYKRIIPMVSWTDNKSPRIYSYNLMLLRVHRPAPFPSNLTFPTLDYYPEGSDVIRIDWSKEKYDSNYPLKEISFELGLDNCKTSNKSKFVKSFDACMFTPRTSSCQNTTGSAMVVDTSTRTYLYGIQTPAYCERQISVAYRIAPIVKRLNHLITKLED